MSKLVDEIKNQSEDYTDYDRCHERKIKGKVSFLKNKITRQFADEGNSA